jgi:hypothetical protein
MKVKTCSYPSDFFAGENLPFSYKKNVPSNMVKGKFWKISRKLATIPGRKL